MLSGLAGRLILASVFKTPQGIEQLYVTVTINNHIYFMITWAVFYSEQLKPSSAIYELWSGSLPVISPSHFSKNLVL